MKIKQVLITPNLAEKLMAKNYRGQRIVKPSLVAYISHIIREGKWNSELPSPLMISPDGYVLDGQHRLLAIIATGASVMAWVAYDVPESTYPDIDSGVSRLLCDRVLFVPEDLKKNKFVAAIVTSFRFELLQRGRPTPQEAMKIFNEHKPAILWVISQQSHDRGLGRAQVALAFAQMFERDAVKAQALANTVWGGDMQRPNGIRLREFLVRGCSGNNVVSHCSFTRYVYQTCVGVCKAEMEGKTLKRLTVATWDEGAK